MNTITIDKDVFTAISVDLTDYDFTGITALVMSFKNYTTDDAKVLFERTFRQSGIHYFTITPQESDMLIDGAVYDFNRVMADGKRYKDGENGKIIIRRGVGEYGE